jgi:hypothetical protein
VIASVECFPISSYTLGRAHSKAAQFLPHFTLSFKTHCCPFPHLPQGINPSGFY